MFGAGKENHKATARSSDQTYSRRQDIALCHQINSSQESSMFHSCFSEGRKKLVKR
ncbi:unnamed protein product [Musa hybrid cultivar]